MPKLNRFFVLVDLEFKFYDKYGDESSFLYDGTRVKILCNAKTICKYAEDAKVQLIVEDDGKINLEKEKPCEKKAGVEFDVFINERTSFGDYKCQVGSDIDSRSSGLPIKYRLCKSTF